MILVTRSQTPFINDKKEEARERENASEKQDQLSSQTTTANYQRA